MKQIFLTALSAGVIVLGGATANAKDSEYLNRLLSETKIQTTALRSDAQQLKNFTTTSDIGWEAHASKLNEMKEHVNRAGKLVTELTNSENQGSPWQQIAIKRITPALREMANNVQATIEQLNAHQSEVYVGPYKEYAAAGADLADDLAQLINDFVNYGRSKGNVEQLRQKLELPRP